MNYIIDPMWFYWINIFQALDIISILFAIASAIGIIIAVFCYFDNIEYGSDDTDVKNSKKALKFLIPVFSFTLIAAICIPSKNTLLQIMVARLATKENVNITVEGLKSVANYIVEVFKTIK